MEYYEGEWYADKRCGWGRMFYEDGSVYEGEWDDDKCNGRGMLRLGKTEIFLNWMCFFWSVMICLPRPGLNFRIAKRETVDNNARLLLKDDTNNFLVVANNDRYEGEWKGGKKNGPGRYFYLGTGQVFHVH